MSFFSFELSGEKPYILELQDGDTFNLTQAIISPMSKGKGKVYLVATVEPVLGEDEELEDISLEELTVKTPICMLAPEKVEQYALNLVFDPNYKVTFTLEGDAKTVVHLLGNMIMNPNEGHAHMGDCDDEDCHGCADEDDEDEDEMFDFGDSDEEDEDDEEEEVPMLKPNTKGKIKEIPDVPAIEAASAKKQQPAKKNAAAAQPAKKEQPQPAKKEQPQQSQPKKAAAPQPAKKEQPKKEQPAAAQQNGKRPAENAPKQQQKKVKN